MKTVNIKGKEYVEVNERISWFRTNCPNYSLVTKVLQLDDDVCCMEAQIYSPDGRLVANGHARELRKSSNINATSYVENCETSAWGRALGNFGIGVDKSICSALELVLALEGQKNVTNTPEHAPAPAPAPEKKVVKEPEKKPEQPTAPKKEETPSNPAKLTPMEITIKTYILAQSTLEDAKKAIAENKVNIVDPKWSELRDELNAKFAK